MYEGQLPEELPDGVDPDDVFFCRSAFLASSLQPVSLSAALAACDPEAEQPSAAATSSAGGHSSASD